MKFLIALTLILTSFTYGASKDIRIEIPIALKDKKAKLNTDKFSYRVEVCNLADSSSVDNNQILTSRDDKIFSLTLFDYKPAKYLLKATILEKKLIDNSSGMETYELKDSKRYKVTWTEIDLTNVTGKEGDSDYIKCDTIYMQKNK